MPNTMRLIAGRLPRVTPDEVRRFVGTVEVRDAEAFAAELEVFMQEWLHWRCSCRNGCSGSNCPRLWR